MTPTLLFPKKMRCFIFIPIDKTELANHLAVKLGNDNPAEAFTFGGLRLSSTGQEPATHTACDIVLSPEKAEEAREAVEKIGGIFLDNCRLFPSAEDGTMKMVLNFEEAKRTAGLFRIQSENEI